MIVQICGLPFRESKIAIGYALTSETAPEFFIEKGHLRKGVYTPENRLKLAAELFGIVTQKRHEIGGDREGENGDIVFLSADLNLPDSPPIQIPEGESFLETIVSYFKAAQITCIVKERE